LLDVHLFSTLRRSASRLLAASLIEIDPELLLVDGGALMAGFYYDFVPSYEVSEPFLHLVEERMRKLIKEGINIEVMEMGKKNGREYLHHLGHHFPKDLDEDGPGTITLFRLKDFVDTLEPPFVKNTKELCHFRLISLQKIDKNRFRILGSVSDSDAMVKEEVKLFAGYRKKNHRIDGEKEDLYHWDEKGFFWHPKGVALKTACIEYWKGEISNHKFPLIETPFSFQREERIGFHQSFFERSGQDLPFRSAELFLEENLLGEEVLFEGLLNPPLAHRTFDLSFVHQKELLNECISSLQFIDKILNMVPFSKRIVWVFSSCKRAKMFAEEESLIKALEKLGIAYLSEERAGRRCAIEARIKDGLGRLWTGPYLVVHKGKGSSVMVERSLLGLLERWIALLVELAPEEVSRFLKGKTW
jgi:threonyl-tRNA synthetase